MKQIKCYIYLVDSRLIKVGAVLHLPATPFHQNQGIIETKTHPSAKAYRFVALGPSNSK